MGNNKNTPGTRGWSRLRDRTMAVAKNRVKMTFFSGGEKLPKKKWLKSRRRREKKKKKERRKKKKTGPSRASFYLLLPADA